MKSKVLLVVLFVSSSVAFAQVVITPQGYATAADRLSQMDFMRRTARGEVAEVLGAGPNNIVVEQDKPVDVIAERIQLLGGVSLAMAPDVAETTTIPRPPKGREPVPVQISRLLHAHEIILREARTMARQAAEQEDDGTNDLIVSEIVRTNELQVWFVAEHVVDTPAVRVE